jgi:hypothetical protein
MNTWKLALAILVLGTSVYLPKAQATNASSTRANQSESQIILAQANTISGWKNVSSNTWKFSGILPTESAIITAKTDNEYMLMEGQITENNDSKYGIFYGQYKIDLSQFDPNELLVGFGSGFQNKYTTLVETRNISLGRYPGKEYTYREGQKITKVRTFLAGNRIYMLLVENPAVGDASRFFNAFTIL